jgi:hypothetical protein
MLVILEAVAGPVTGRKIEVRAGTILRIGRTARADYALTDDSYLSSLHFSVECDGSLCRVRDLGSSNGTFVNGNRINEQILQEGDSITAGGSTFRVHIDTSTAPNLTMSQVFSRTAPTPVMASLGTRIDQPGYAATASAAAATRPWPGFSLSQGNLLQRLFATGEPVFALLDASRDSRIPAFLDASAEAYVALDPTGRIPIYVTAPTPQSRLLDVLIKDGWGRGWCSYFTAPVGMQEACAHLANYVALYTVQGQRITLRFWDPRVLRMLLPLMPQEEAVSFFGPFTRMIVEGDRPEMAVELTLTPRGPKQEAIAL